LHELLNLHGIDGLTPGGVAVISQSGNVALSIFTQGQQAGLGFSFYVGVGNQTDVGFDEYLAFAAEDPNTTAVILYIEGIKKGPAVLSAIRGVAAKKPVILYKTGRTEAGARSAQSHTGVLAGHFALAEQLFQQAGALVLRRSDTLVPVAQGLSFCPATKGNRVAILTDGGGHGVIATDAVVEAGLSLAMLSQQTKISLRATLGPFATLSNPVDMVGASDSNPYVFATCAHVLATDPDIDMVLITGLFGGYGLRFDASLEKTEVTAATALATIQRTTGKPIMVHSLYASASTAPLLTLIKSKIPVQSSIELAAEALAQLAHRTQMKVSNETTNTFFEQSTPIAPSAPMALTEPEARRLLEAHGFSLKDWLFCTSEADTATAAQRFSDTPVAVKLVSRTILHKSEAGGVVLHVAGENELRDAWRQIVTNAKTYDGTADVQGVLVAPMAIAGVEMILGLLRDATYGPVIMVGFGGIFVELLQDVVFRAPPIDQAEALTMLNTLRGQKLLNGIRGSASIDKEALAELIVALGDLALKRPNILELDLNPVIAHAKGADIVDVRAVLDTEIES
jgi:acetyltransferase